MLRWASDADIDGNLLRGLFLREPALDLVRAQDAGLRTAEDPIVLQWAATEDRILITRDKSTMIGFANARVQAGMLMPGVFVIRRRSSFGRIIDDILMVDFCSPKEEWKDQVLFLPL
jgi:hypothetical protein